MVGEGLAIVVCLSFFRRVTFALALLCFFFFNVVLWWGVVVVSEWECEVWGESLELGL